MAATTITADSTGPSAAINLDWRGGKPVAISVTGSSSGSFSCAVEYTLDDMQLVPASDAVWVTDANLGTLSANSSAIFTYLQPIAAVRLNVAALSSAVLTMKVNQGEGSL